MGSGKSTLTRLAAAHMPVTDCDALNSRLLEKGQPGYQALKKAYPFLFDAAGLLDRKKMADVLFTDPEEKKKMEAILHPLIVSAMDAWIAAQPGFCAVEVPLLFELGLQDHFDETWCVTADQDTALARLEQGRNIAPAEALRRLKAQTPAGTKAQMADVVFDNSRDLAWLEDQLQKRLNALEGQPPEQPPAV